MARSKYVYVSMLPDNSIVGIHTVKHESVRDIKMHPRCSDIRLFRAKNGIDVNLIELHAFLQEEGKTETDSQSQNETTAQ